MILVDVLRSDDYDFHINKLKSLTTWIKENETHRNKSNYYNLEDSVHLFDSFEIIYDNENIVAFSGLFNHGYYPSNCARCCTRTYYHPDYRNTGCARTARWSEDWFIPYEVKVAKELEYEYAFISIELLMRRKSMKNLVDYISKDGDWILHEEMCNTCRQHNDNGDYIGVNRDPGCWQNVCYKQLVSPVYTPFCLPSISMADYEKDYAYTQKSKLQRLR